MALNISKKQLLLAIKDSAGIISTVAKRLNVEWHTADSYIKKYDECIQAINDESEKVIDLAESKIIGAIQNSDMQTCRWFLATKGKKRGYTERTELTGADGDSIKFESQDKLDLLLSKKTPEQIKEIEKLLIDE